jgi:hypothetical protein
MYKYEKCRVCRRPLKPNQSLEGVGHSEKVHTECAAECAKRLVWTEAEIEFMGLDDPDYLEQEREAEVLGMTRTEYLEMLPDVAMNRAKARLMAIGKRRRLRVLLKLGLQWFGIPEDLPEEQTGRLAPIVFEYSRSKALPRRHWRRAASRH